LGPRPKIYPFTNEINIYRNKVAIISLEDELVAVVIESESIANGQRSIFELAWKGAGEKILIDLITNYTNRMRSKDRLG